MKINQRLLDKKIVITGASSGIGEILAKKIASQGGFPILVARSRDKLVTIQKEIDQLYNQKSAIYPIDLTDNNKIDHLIPIIFNENKQVDGLINNAGVGVFDSIEDMNYDDLLEMFQLNVFAGIQLSQSILPYFRKTNANTQIVNVISQAAKISTPKSAAYASSKQAMLGFTNVLRLECKMSSISIMAVNLGPVRTNFFERADKDGTYKQNVERYMLDPERVADKIVTHLFTSKREINMPLWMELGSIFYRLIPGVMEAVLRKQFDKK
ncbi:MULTISPECIES: SDR family oxidoreductase [Oceanobacillus]|uniref:Oxidoreductase n=1 Tax=Oceanobacillus kimchii TaxID=746691 RepID=A0ABQ5TL80_9BACI|nr:MULTISPECIES: SDR family oxidoreductase [Oceanobacillus]MBT2598396.1 SDR family oxidoreductase [Oceanobacillus sp. ISL-74]MBT2651314.1 SDR family oxidoreductase [Oceanobacillus sp. ISL-73]MCT1575973.1 SDR family oxidoreductase [Oceanobacillus kimchii]MCT2135610.1 SDR family oxidoreductase [Oceanobacillus kimchii]OEH55710.1 oxidoreductase [Oceanobacillus sp. E9]